MKKITYYCDICGKEASDRRREMDCVRLNMDYTHNWEDTLPVAKHLYDIQMCKECGETLNSIIKLAIDAKGFDRICYKGENYDN